MQNISKSLENILEEKSHGRSRQNAVVEEAQIWSLINSVRSAPILSPVKGRLAYLGCRE